MNANGKYTPGKVALALHHIRRGPGRRTGKASLHDMTRRLRENEKYVKEIMELAREYGFVNIHRRDGRHTIYELTQKDVNIAAAAAIIQERMEEENATQQNAG